jgi:hypothetical protein
MESQLQALRLVRESKQSEADGIADSIETMRGALVETASQIENLKISIQSDATLRESLIHRRRLEVADEFYSESLSKALTMGLALLQWRRSVFQTQRLRKLHLKRSHREAMALKSNAFDCLTKNTFRCIAQKEAVLYVHSKRIRKHLILWSSVYHQSKKIQLFVKISVCKRLQLRFFVRMKRLLRKARKNAKLSQRHAAMVTCFVALRAFNAWKRAFQKSHLIVSSLPDAAMVVRADKFFVRTLYKAWLTSFRARSRLLLIKSEALRRTRRIRVLRSCLREWGEVLKAASHWRRVVHYKVLSKLETMMRKRQESRELANSAADTYEKGLMAETFLFLRRIARKGRDLVAKATALSALHHRRRLVSSWRQWSCATLTQQRSVEQSGDAIEHYLRSLVSKHFKAWVANVYKEHEQKSLLPLIEPNIALLKDSTTLVVVKADALDAVSDDSAPCSDDDKDDLAVTESQSPSLRDLCVLSRRYLSRWAHWSRYRHNTRRTAHCVRKKTELRTCRQVMSCLFCAWVKRLRTVDSTALSSEASTYENDVQTR